jgi:hypothetical protein
MCLLSDQILLLQPGLSLQMVAWARCVRNVRRIPSLGELSFILCDTRPYRMGSALKHLKPKPYFRTPGYTKELCTPAYLRSPQRLLGWVVYLKNRALMLAGM